jgi:uncharacterized membrane protein
VASFFIPPVMALDNARQVCPALLNQGMQKFIIKPNNSLLKRELMLLGGGFALLMIVMAVRFWVLGMWLVVPFLLLDFLVVAAAFFLIRKKGRVHESIYIDDVALKIHHHERQRTKSWSFDIHWVKVLLQEHEHPWHSSRLLVGSHGKWIEFAGFLTDDERVSLSRALKHSIQSHHV